MLKRRTSKPYQFKAPPQLKALFPLILSYTVDLRTANSVETKAPKRLHVDLSLVEEVDVIGAVVFAANLAKSLRDHSEFEFQIKDPRDKGIARYIAEMNLA